jgi:hypothetical protein
MRKIYEVNGYWREVTEVDGRVAHHGQHIGAFIECESAGRAAAIIEAKYPGVTIDSVVRRGNRIIIVDGAP